VPRRYRGTGSRCDVEDRKFAVLQRQPLFPPLFWRCYPAVLVAVILLFSVRRHDEIFSNFSRLSEIGGAFCLA
jgi:hypothetical protein